MLGYLKPTETHNDDQNDRYRKAPCTVEPFKS